MMMGPNCLEWIGRTGRHVDGHPRATKPTEVARTGAADLVTDVVTAAEAALADDVAGRGRAGVCNACADGIDLRVQVTTPSGELALDSVDQDFRADVAVFDAIAALEAELVATTDVEPVSR